jgi:ribonuclease P protein component
MRKSLTREETVKKKSDIDAIFKTGRRFSKSDYKLMVSPNSLNRNRIVVIPVKKYGNAVQRNRIRRQIKEIWRIEKTQFKNGFDFAFVVYPGKVLDHETQRKYLIDLFSKADVYLSK